MSEYGRLSRVARQIARILIPTYKIKSDFDVPSPAVFICRHNNMLGPTNVIAWYPKYLRIWVLNVFMEKEACYRQFADYTFHKRFGWPKWAARTVSGIISPFVVNLMASMGAIPVYRNSMESIRTIKETLKALIAGDTVLIFPDIDYTATNAEVRKVYEGFLYLERYYYNKTGKHIPFVPLRLDQKLREIVVGEAVCFADGIDFLDQKESILDQIQAKISGG
ncbi:MAG: glycerol acyltransferase [Negativicutes bacterium]|nr:glycerol acyltransferase [Negativicutes bacterium]